jgi:signal transduction histidine kinase
MRIPITCIKGYTDLLAKGTAGPIDESQAEFLATIGTNADRLTRLVSDLSDIARIETGPLRLEVSRVELAKVVREIAEGMQTQFAKKDQVLKVDVPEQLPAAYGDRDRLAQVTSPPLTVKP